VPCVGGWRGAAPQTLAVQDRQGHAEGGERMAVPDRISDEGATTMPVVRAAEKPVGGPLHVVRVKLTQEALAKGRRENMRVAAVQVTEHLRRVWRAQRHVHAHAEGIRCDPVDQDQTGTTEKNVAVALFGQLGPGEQEPSRVRQRYG